MKNPRNTFAFFLGGVRKENDVEEEEALMWEEHGVTN